MLIATSAQTRRPGNTHGLIYRSATQEGNVIMLEGEKPFNTRVTKKHKGKGIRISRQDFHK
jgi:hypothetical protein